MKRPFRYAGLLLAAAVAGSWTWTHRPAGSAAVRADGWSAAAAAPAGADARAPEPATTAEQYRTLLREFQTLANAHWQATTDDERKGITARIDALTTACLELIQRHPQDPIALEALTQVVTQEYWLNNHTSHPGWGEESRQAKAIVLLLRDHLNSDQLGETCKRVHFGFRQECETFLRMVLDKSPHREVRALACLRLAQFLTGRMERLDLLKEQPGLAQRYEILYGQDYLEGLQRQDRVRALKEAETFYEQAIEQYGDVKIPFDVTVRERAQTDLFEIRNLAIGKSAPGLEGVDQEGQPLKLSDYRGKVVLLYFWSEY